MNSAAAALLGPDAVRERCAEILAAGEAGNLAHFEVRMERLAETARYVCATIRENYPELEIPFHSRWRHFTMHGIDRWGALAEQLPTADTAERARVRIELAVTSVLLDAGAGDAWRYAEPATGRTYARSEGLAVASLRLFESGAFSSVSGEPMRACAAGLAAFDQATLETGFQVRTDNRLVGVAGRVELLHGLGRALRAYPELFGERAPRVGRLYDVLAAKAAHGVLGAPDILETVLHGLGSIWPGRLVIEGRNLGDVWRHPAVHRDDASDGLVPFHKLSQWLSYSLVEPLQEAGLEVTDLDRLTGLAEYRNGGLFLDLGVLAAKAPDAAAMAHDVGSELVVEWRALTVALLDRLAPLVRRELGLDGAQLPLMKLLQGGTWDAGRRIAAERRAGGGPPIRVRSDGTVF